MKRKPLILNIDDNEAGRYVMCKQLRQAEFDVAEAGAGEAGLQMAATHVPDLILLDVRLPDIDGFEVCRRIRDNPAIAGIPVIQMSASYVDTSSRVKGLENGADAYLTHPLESSMLLATIRSLLRMKRAEQTVRHAASRWQTTFDAIQDGVALLDVDGHSLQANAAFSERLGAFSERLGNEAASTYEIIGDLFGRCRSTSTRQTTEHTSAGKILSIRMDPVRESMTSANSGISRST